MEDLLGLLPSLIALVEEGSVTRAARRIGISQSRMSARLATLRQTLADPLLVPASGTRGLVSTDRARDIAEAVRTLVGGVADVLGRDRFDPTTATRTFSIMANDNAAALAGLPLAASIRAAAGPGVRVALHQFDARRLGELEDSRLDLALGAATQFDAVPSLIARAVIRDVFASAVRHEGRPAAELDEYCAREHVLVSGDGGGFDGLVDGALARIGRHRRVALSVQSYLVAIDAVRSSDLVATLTRRLLARHNRELTVFTPPLHLPPFALSAAWHSRADRDGGHRWMRERLPTG